MHRLQVRKKKAATNGAVSSKSIVSTPNKFEVDIPLGLKALVNMLKTDRQYSIEVAAGALSSSVHTLYDQFPYLFQECIHPCIHALSRNDFSSNRGRCYMWALLSTLTEKHVDNVYKMIDFNIIPMMFERLHESENEEVSYEICGLLFLLTHNDVLIRQHKVLSDKILDRIAVFRDQLETASSYISTGTQKISANFKVQSRCRACLEKVNSHMKERFIRNIRQGKDSSSSSVRTRTNFLCRPKTSGGFISNYIEGKLSVMELIDQDPRLRYGGLVSRSGSRSKHSTA
jgi:hypothetical protein